jgi:predicted acylesterase/phospholipase RssA
VRSPEGHFLVDGGVANNLPTDVMRDVFDPMTIIAWT